MRELRYWEILLLPKEKIYFFTHVYYISILFYPPYALPDTDGRVSCSFEHTFPTCWWCSPGLSSNSLLPSLCFDRLERLIFYLFFDFYELSMFMPRYVLKAFSFHCFWSFLVSPLRLHLVSKFRTRLEV